ncbi:MAG: MarR family winged helix-turn-helix transcriptional regulator [Lachnospiraceae bacterium]|nr:MarR family winged helix-turn-helix transcriptional regulator [Lachnospiraceae bacterium]
MTMTDRFELFVTTITQIYKNLQRIKSHEMAEFDLKGTHVMCMFELNRHPEGLTATELRALCEEDKAAISRMISELIDRGLVSNPGEKKYRSPLTLTEEGKNITRRINEMAANAAIAGSADMSHEERMDFYNTLTGISDNLKHYLESLD